MPSDFNIPLSMPSWNEQVTARPQAGLLSQQEALHRERVAQLEAARAAAAELPAGSFSYERLSDLIPPVENFAPPPLQNLIQQPQHIGGSTTGLIGGPPPIDKQMTLTKRFPQQVGADSYEHRMGVTQQPGLLVDQPNNAGLVGRPQPMPQPTLSDFQSGMTPDDIQNMLRIDRMGGKRQMTAPPDNSGYIPRQQPTLSGEKQFAGAAPKTRIAPLRFEAAIVPGSLANEGGIEEGTNHVANRGIDSRHHDVRTQRQKDNGVSNKQAIRDMSEEDAVALYKDKYWEHPRFDEINDDNIGRKVFDMGINLGTPRATRMLQKSVRELGYTHDGQGMGPGTSRAIDQAIADGKKDDLLRLLSEKQASHYVKLVQDDQDQYGPSMKGWLTRGLYESGNLGL